MTHKQNPKKGQVSYKYRTGTRPLADVIWLTCPKCLNLFGVSTLDLPTACPLEGGISATEGTPTFGCEVELTKEEWTKHITPVKIVDVDRSEGK